MRRKEWNLRSKWEQGGEKGIDEAIWGMEARIKRAMEKGEKGGKGKEKAEEDGGMTNMKKTKKK